MVNPENTPAEDPNGLLSGATVGTGYKLQGGSPLIGRGKYISQMGDRDFYGNAVSSTVTLDIGVEVASR